MSDYFDDFLDELHDEGCQEYEFDRDMSGSDIEPNLTQIINDEDLPFSSANMGMALGLAEEIAEEDRYREIETMPFSMKREVPAGGKLVSFKNTPGVVKGRGKFEAYVNDLIAKKNSNIP